MHLIGVDLMGVHYGVVPIMRRKGATILYYVWFLGCHWKGLLDSLFGRVFSLHLLARRLREQEQRQKKGS